LHESGEYPWFTSRIAFGLLVFDKDSIKKNIFAVTFNFGRIVKKSWGIYVDFRIIGYNLEIIVIRPRIDYLIAIGIQFEYDILGPIPQRNESTTKSSQGGIE
jgi:hypothetical protein